MKRTETPGLCYQKYAACCKMLAKTRWDQAHRQRAVPSSFESCNIDEIGQISSAEARCAPCNHLRRQSSLSGCAQEGLQR